MLELVMQPLAEWRDDARVEEICINGLGVVHVRRGGVFASFDVAMDYDDLYDIAILAGALRKQDIGERRPLLSCDFAGGRLQSVLPPCVPHGTVSHTIRRLGTFVAPLSAVPGRYNTERWNMWTRRREAQAASMAHVLAVYDTGDLPAFLAAIVAARFNILLCGGTGSGKTSMSRTLTALIDPAERVLTIEDALELVVPQPNHVRLLYSKGDLSGANIGPMQLLEATLRMRPDRVLLQELRDPEAAYVYINEVMTGHPGSITTIHGRNAAQAMARLFTLVKGSPEGRSYDDATLLHMISHAVDVVIPFETAGTTYSIREVWLAADAARRGERFHDLMQDV